MRRLIVTAVAAAMLPLPAAAHGDAGADHWLTLDPWVWMPMALTALLYLRGVLTLRARHSPAHAAQPHAIAGFCAGMAALVLALIWPLDALGALSFAAHMAQHMMLIAVAAPLLVLAEPMTALRCALPKSWRRINRRLSWLHHGLRFLLRPGVAFAAHGVLVWVWHAPRLFEWALRREWVHVIEHISFLGSALLFWSALQQIGRTTLRYGGRNGAGHGEAALWTLGTLMHTGLLGALLTFAPRPLYASYINMSEALLPPMVDQQLAGLLMWIPGGVCYMVAGLGYAALWLRGAGRERRSPAK